MSAQLDILALEPFYGGARRLMLESLMRYSRHRWTLLKLPPRRIERRLAAAAHWFAEQISRHWVGRVDLVFTSEALNLADLLRLLPDLAGKPTVVYFHDNQLPPPGERTDNPLNVVNLSSASSATEIWFNSLYHLRTFLKRASALVGRVPELRGLNPVPELTGKAQLMPPPVDLSLSLEIRQRETIERDKRQLFVDTRDADVRMLSDALMALTRRGEKYKLVTVGPVEGLDEELPRTTLSETDEEGQIRAICQSQVLISARPGAPYDHHAVRALHLGCWPIFPNTGFYPELLPASLHPLCLYDGTHASRLATQLQNVWWLEQPAGYEDELAAILAQFDAVAAVQAMDQRLEQVAVAHSLG